MKKITLNIVNEYDRLTHVVVGTAQGYHRNAALVEVVNETQRTTFDAGAFPTEKSLIPEFNNFKRALKENGVHVYEPELAPDTVQDQTCPRDIGFVIGDVLVISSMYARSRSEEIEGISYLFESWQGNIINAPKDVFIEGGDVIIDQERIFVGVGQRSNSAGVEFLKTNFGDKYQIVPMPCRSLADGEDVLHLDCTFQPLGLGHALIYPDGLEAIPAEISDKYSLIPVERPEADALATNIFSIRPDTLIARAAPECARVNEELRKRGYQVIEVQFDLVPSTGGSFRCATLPVRRC